MNVLVIYYSRTVRTKKIAEEIQASLGGELDEIQNTVNRNGLIGWLRAGRDAGTKSLTSIKSLSNPVEYDLIILGSPTWNGTVSTPVRTYITNFIDNMPKVACFTTGEGEEPTALEEMTRLLGDKVVAKMHLVRKTEVDANSYHEKLGVFLEQIKDSHEPPRPS